MVLEEGGLDLEERSQREGDAMDQWGGTSTPLLAGVENKEATDRWGGTCQLVGIPRAFYDVMMMIAGFQQLELNGASTFYLYGSLTFHKILTKAV